MTTLRHLISRRRKMAEELPLVHTTLSENLPSLVSLHEIRPTPCPVFGENLVYFFYGRPAYRSSKGRQPGEDFALCPVCFVFKPQVVSRKVVRVFPCDTGALHGNRFQPHLSATDLPELELDPRIESARRLVSTFFQTNGRYFYGKTVTSIRLINGTAAFRFHQLLLASGPVGYDDRKSAVEVQVREPVSLRDQLSFVVLPGEYLDDPTIRRAILEDWNCDPEPYNTIQGTSPSEFYPIVRQLIATRFHRATRI
jgi:hypothetical protein